MNNTTRLDDNKTMDSFTNRNFVKIVDEIIINSSNRVEVKINPKFKTKLDLFYQYNENAFEVLNRLSWIYNEWFYSNGIQYYFGKPDTIDTFDLTL